MSRNLFFAVAMMFTSTALALELPNNSHLQAQENQDHARGKIAIGAYDQDQLPTIIGEGKILREAWKIEGTSQTSFQILVNLRKQLTEIGYDVLFQCESFACGGYDFRFDIGYFKSPELFIDLGNFHYLSAQKDESYVSILTSNAQENVYIELTQIAPEGDSSPGITAQSTAGTPATDATPPVISQAALDLATQLKVRGRAILPGLTFATASSRLSTKDAAILEELAAYLAKNPEHTIVLVGHTDSVGALAGNIALSKKRAASVMQQLVSQYGVNKRQISAQGVGFLMPLASNLTQVGRDLNRRVEAVLTSTN